jgi:hypothetical protein
VRTLRALVYAATVTSVVTSCATYSGLDSSQPSLVGDDGGSAGAATTSGGTSSGGANTGAGATAATSGAANSGGVGGISTSEAGATDSAGSGSSAIIVPTGVTVSGFASDLTKAPHPDGAPYSDRCPDGQVLIGFYGTVDPSGDPSYLRSEQGICGIVGVSASEPWSVTVTEADPLPMHDVELGLKQTAKCPLDQVMIGFGGRSGLWMDSVDIRCSPLKILGMSPNFLLVAGTPKTAGTIGGNQGGSPFDPLDCDPGSVAVGQVGNTAYSSNVLGSFGVRCAAVTLETGPG